MYMYERWPTGFATTGGEVRNSTVEDAKARFGELLDVCLSEGPQMVIKQGAKVAVLVPAQEPQRTRAAKRPTVKELLLSDEALANLILPARGLAKRRANAVNSDSLTKCEFNFRSAQVMPLRRGSCLANVDRSRPTSHSNRKIFCRKNSKITLQ